MKTNSLFQIQTVKKYYTWGSATSLLEFRVPARFGRILALTHPDQILNYFL